jgi:hypothetical protein
LEDRGNVGESSCNFADGTDQSVQSLMFMMTMMMMMMIIKFSLYLAEILLKLHVGVHSTQYTVRSTQYTVHSALPR